MASVVVLAQEPEAIISRKQTAEPVTAGQKVTVQNPYGDVRARRAAGKSLEVFAVIQNLDPDSPAPDLQTQRGDGALAIRVVSAEAPREGADRADLVVYVRTAFPLQWKRLMERSSSRDCTRTYLPERSRGPFAFSRLQGMRRQ